MSLSLLFAAQRTNLKKFYSKKGGIGHPFFKKEGKKSLRILLSNHHSHPVDYKP